ncbi:MAG: hypothetical protein AAGA43_07055 [Bacteroidota bacterium]
MRRSILLFLIFLVTLYIASVTENPNSVKSDTTVVSTTSFTAQEVLNDDFCPPDSIANDLP